VGQKANVYKNTARRASEVQNKLSVKSSSRYQIQDKLSLERKNVYSNRPNHSSNLCKTQDNFVKPSNIGNEYENSDQFVLKTSR